MASIRKLSNKWQVQIRRKGHQSFTKSFTYRKDAETWARIKERELDNGGVKVDRSEIRTTSLADLLLKYRDTIVSRKRSRRIETYLINAFIKHKFASLSLSAVSPRTFAYYRDERLKVVKPASVCRELAIYRHAFQVAIDEWHYPIDENPLLKVKKPKVMDSRNRRLELGELDTMMDYCKERQLPDLLNVIIMAVKTGMRRAELLRLTKEHFNPETRTLYIPITKSGYPRTIPLTLKAAAIIDSLGLHQGIYSKSTEGFMSAWQRLIKRTGIIDLRFHDLRHEAISRFFEMGLSVPEVALISGHRDYRMLQRYTHLKPEEVALKLL
ncbi:MAG: site-specific integrase [Kordiimonadaceae bacterium]|nr:site-specific integrase [Kordiimonadaceae bacterium]